MAIHRDAALRRDEARMTVFRGEGGEAERRPNKPCETLTVADGAAGETRWPPLLDDPRALAMLIDIFSERGFHAVVDIHRIDVPQKVDLATGLIKCFTKKVYRIQIRFQGSEIRCG